MRPIELKGKSHNLYVGDSFPILVNCNVGGNNLSAIGFRKRENRYFIQSSGDHT